MNDVLDENAVASRQLEMDKLYVLYEICNEYDISLKDARRLCDIAGFDYSDLAKFTGELK